MQKHQQQQKLQHLVGTWCVLFFSTRTSHRSLWFARMFQIPKSLFLLQKQFFVIGVLASSFKPECVLII